MPYAQHTLRISKQYDQSNKYDGIFCVAAIILNLYMTCHIKWKRTKHFVSIFRISDLVVGVALMIDGSEWVTLDFNTRRIITITMLLSLRSKRLCIHWKSRLQTVFIFLSTFHSSLLFRRFSLFSSLFLLAAHFGLYSTLFNSNKVMRFT